MKKHSKKKKIFAGILAGALAVVAGAGVYAGVFIANAPWPSSAPPKLAPMHVSYVVDPNDPRQLAGLVDYVFVGKAEQLAGVKYDNIGVVLTEKGPRIGGSPRTTYNVAVLENLKGDLEVNATLPVTKDGGVSMDGKYLILDAGDYLPEEGDVCMFFASRQSDNSLLVAGLNCNVKLARAASLEAVQALPEYKRLAQACANAIPFVR